MMEREEFERRLSVVMEELAGIEHKRWAHWQSYMHSKGTRQADGSLLLSADLVAHWETQIATVYEGLSEKEKESDREQGPQVSTDYRYGFGQPWVALSSSRDA